MRQHAAACGRSNGRSNGKKNLFAGAFYHMELQIQLDGLSQPFFEQYRTFEDAMNRVVFLNKCSKLKDGCKFTVFMR